MSRSSTSAADPTTSQEGYIDRATLTDYQLARFRALIEEIQPHNRFYAEKFAHLAVDPANLRSPGRFRGTAVHHQGGAAPGAGSLSALWTFSYLSPRALQPDAPDLRYVRTAATMARHARELALAPGVLERDLSNCGHTRRRSPLLRFFVRPVSRLLDGIRGSESPWLPLSPRRRNEQHGAGCGLYWRIRQRCSSLLQPMLCT